MLGFCFASFGSPFGMADGPKLIACVGDVHGLWNEESEEALRFLRPDLSLFVGDFGEEDVALVRSIAKIPERKAVILGNHDGWFSTSGKGSIEGVEEQLDLLGDDHVGLSVASLPDLGLSVVGCRPCRRPQARHIRRKVSSGESNSIPPAAELQKPVT